MDNEKYIYVVLKALPAIALIGKQYQEQVVYETKLKNGQDWDPANLMDEEDIGPEVFIEI